MSHRILKTKYNQEGDYGTTEEHFVYCHHNNTSDHVTFYDENGNFIMCIPDTIDNNLLDAINRLYTPLDDDKTILIMDEDDKKKCNL